MRKLFIFLIVCFVALSTRIAKAEVIAFNDTHNYWPGWGNVQDDGVDRIGSPELTGGQATVTDGKLNNLTFTGDSSWWNTLVSPGDLFIDLGANNSWDYVVDLTSWSVPGADNPDPGAGPYNLYHLTTPLPLNTSSGYTSGYILSGVWGPGYSMRENHPVAANSNVITGAALAGSANFSGWNNNLGLANYPDVFTFSGQGLDLGPSGQFAIGWGVNCANDVIYETLSYNPIPEPATMALFGIGLTGMGLLRRKKISA